MMAAFFFGIRQRLQFTEAYSFSEQRTRSIFSTIFRKPAEY